MLAPTTLWDPSLRQATDQATAGRLAWLLGLCLPLSGGLSLSNLIPGYPDQVTVIRLVTLVALLWLVDRSLGTTLPKAARRMLQAFALVMAYGAVSLLWAPDLPHGLHDLITIGLALSTAVAAILLVRGDRLALRSFALGVLISGGLQVVVAVGEVVTGRHLSLSFGTEYVAQWNLVSIEQAIGAVSWGSLGNPNDLGGYLLITSAVFLSMGAYGIELGRSALILGWGLFLVSVAVGLTSLADARAYRLGLAIVVAMHALDWFLTPGRTMYRVPLVLLMGGMGLTLASWMVGPVLQSISNAGQSDALRLTLISEGLSSALLSGGFGRGLGTEKWLIDAGEVPLNFHNVVAQIAAELGLVVAGVFLVYLAWLVISWAFATRSARLIGRDAAIARATLSVALLVYGVTASGVLESPHYWAFFALTALVAGASPRDPRPSRLPSVWPAAVRQGVWGGAET